MFAALATFVSRRWKFVILMWLMVLLLVGRFAPKWDDVTHDGDLAYLPIRMPSVQAELVLDEAFPHDRSKSQMVVVIGREDRRLDSPDRRIADDLARRFYRRLGIAGIRRAAELSNDATRLFSESNQAEAKVARSRAQRALNKSHDALHRVMQLDDALLNCEYLSDKHRFSDIADHLALLSKLQDENTDDSDPEKSYLLTPELSEYADSLPAQPNGRLPLLDVWSQHTNIVKSQLQSKDGKAQLIVLQLENEFLATDNIRVLEIVEQELAAVRDHVQHSQANPPTVGISGSAAVGGDMLRSAADSIRYTEVFTIILILLILLAVYRAPLLVTVPLITIGVSVKVATGLVAALTQLHVLPGMEWWDFKVFTTTKIFIVVILFGAGTDYCLFLISRYREHIAAGIEKGVAVAKALSGVGDALAASALTTIFGLAMMYFAEFGKFRSSGPAIGLCLAVTLLACVTLAPALLRAFGKTVFWPLGDRALPKPVLNSERRTSEQSLLTRFWQGVARVIVRRPGAVLLGSIALLLPLAWMGSSVEVTYDFLSQIDPKRPSRQGTELLRRHFPVGETGPVTVLANKVDGGFEATDKGTDFAALNEIHKLTETLHNTTGVRRVLSLSEPLGNPPSGLSMTTPAGREKVVLRRHPLVKDVFLTPVPQLQGDVARFELILDHDPFSIEAVHSLTHVDQKLSQLAERRDSFWYGTDFTYSGTTAAIRDLRDVTRSDTVRIQSLVVLAVFTVLLIIIRKPIESAFMIASVLFSFYVTIGATELFFGLAYGETYHGLDWKVPIFLFVILVAIGQDYNVYLATRVFEEQQRFGPFGGLRRAVILTGGIITSCGVIMAGTFLTMTAASWPGAIETLFPAMGSHLAASSGALRGIVELGFALALGVSLDTFVVRPILLPAFLAIMCRWQASPRTVSTVDGKVARQVQ